LIFLQIKEIEISSLIEYENNPRNNDGAVDAVAESIKQFGFKVPIVIDRDNVIVAGHTRLKAARKIGLEKVPCIVADDLTPEQIKAYRLADNKTGELAEWDFSALEIELAEIESDFDMSAFGFDISDFEDIHEITEDEVPEVDEENEPICKTGDIWNLGKHRLMCGDSTNVSDVEKLMNGDKADLLLTDPPYNVAYEGGTKEKLKIENDDMSDEEFQEFLISAFENSNIVMKDGASFYIWHSDSEGFNFRSACKNTGWKIRQCLIWVKNSIVLGRQDYQWKHEPCLYGWKDGAAHYFVDDRTQSTVWEFNKPLRNMEHPTMKPVDLIARAINNSSRSDNIVLDIFGGSGTTLIACEQLNRKCYMMELDPKYCDVIIKRWENLTGEKAVKIDMN
jgi:site-specific DNA-methyltransferase (adenine-specific)